MTINLNATIGNKEWLKINEAGLKAMLPKTWTHMHNLDALRLGYQLKLIGVDWRSQEEFGKVMVYLEKIGLLLRDGLNVKANHQSIFDRVE